MNLLKHIRFFYYILFFATPLAMSASTSEIFEFNKMIGIYFCTMIIATLWSIDFIMHKRIIMKPRILFFALIFLITQIISTFTSIDPHTSIFGYYGRFNGGLLSIFAYIILLFVFVQVFTKEDLKTLLKVSLFASLTVMVWGIPGRFGSDLSCALFTGQFTNACWTAQFQPEVRMFSTLGQPNWLGAYLAIHVFVGGFFLLNSLLPKKTKEQSVTFNLEILKTYLSHWNWGSTFYFAYTLFTVLCIWFTRSRSSLLAVAIGFMAIIYVLLWKFYKKLAPIFIAGIVLSVIAVAVYVTTLDLSTIRQTNVTESFDIRKVVWKGAIDLGLRYPLFGTGVETFAYSYYFTRPVAHNLTSEWDFLYNKAHNEFLNYFATTGFVGLIAYMLFLGFALWIITKKSLAEEHAQPLALYVCLIGALVTIHVTNFFGFSTTTVQLFFYLIPGFFIAWHTLEAPQATIQRVGWMQKIIVIMIAIIGVAGCTYFMNYYRADKIYARVDAQLAASDYQSAISLLDNATQLHYEHVYEDKLSSTLASLAYVVHTSNPNEKDLAQKLITLAETYSTQTLVMAPKNVLYFKTLAKNSYLFYLITKDEKRVQQSIQALEAAKKIAPTDVKLMHTLALFYSNFLKDTQDAGKKAEYKKKALQELNTALHMKPGYGEAVELKKVLESQ